MRTDATVGTIGPPRPPAPSAAPALAVACTPAVSLLAVRHASIPEILAWDQLVARFPGCRIGHTRAWLRSLEACGKGDPLYLVFERGADVVGCLPGLLTRVGPLRLFGSPLPGWQTWSMGPVFDPGRVTTRELGTALVTFLAQHYGVHHVELMTGALDPATMREAGFRGDPELTYRAPLYPGDEARAWRALRDSARRNIRRAINLGLVVRFAEDAAFADEHYDQVREVYVRGGNVVPFGPERVRACVQHMRTAGKLLAVSVSLPDGPVIATGIFLVHARELFLWTWAHRSRYRWYRPTELMTWTVMQRAMALGCNTFDLMGGGDFKRKFGAEPELTKYRWVWSRYPWITRARDVAGVAHRWQQSLRGRLLRLALRSTGAFAAASPTPPAPPPRAG